MNIGEGEVHHYLNNMDSTIVLETLTIHGTEWIYASNKYKGFEPK